MKRVPLRRTGKLKPKKRTAKEFARIYGSRERVEFVKRLPCAACGVVGYSENAHVLGNGGLSRKAGFETIAPLCDRRPFGSAALKLPLYAGCHYCHDEEHEWFSTSYPNFTAEAAASETEKLWQEHAGSRWIEESKKQ